MTEPLTTYVPAAALVDDEEIALFMADAFETGDTTYTAKICQGTRPGDTVTPLQFFVEIGMCRATLHE